MRESHGTGPTMFPVLRIGDGALILVPIAMFPELSRIRRPLIRRDHDRLLAIRRPPLPNCGQPCFAMPAAAEFDLRTARVVSLHGLSAAGILRPGVPLCLLWAEGGEPVSWSDPDIGNTAIE